MLSGLSLSQVTPGAVGIFAILASILIWQIRTWPLTKQRVNEARKIQLDADESLLAKAFLRITQLEANQNSDRAAFNEALHDERKRCDAELDEIRNRAREEADEVRLRLRAAEEECRGLLAMIRQNSESTAMLITNPGQAAVTLAARQARGEANKP